MASTVQFCDRCDNKYYHTVNQKTGLLMLYCRACSNTKTDISGTMGVITTNIRAQAVNLNNLVNKFTIHDPTLPHHYLQCPNAECGTNVGPDAPHVADVAIIRYNYAQMKYIYICTKCEHVWEP